MKKFLKFLLYAVLALVVLVGGLITYVKTALPNVGPDRVTIDVTAATT